MLSLGRDVLRRLGDGEAIDSICQSAGWTRAEFDERWKREAASRAPRCDGQVPVGVTAAVTIERDRWGIPHIFADGHRDLWFGFGYAMAQDRLFQMDYLRRKGLGRLAEVLGPEGVPLDLIARTVGLNRIAKDEWTRLPQETRELQQAFADGVNAWIKQCGEQLPIEFDLLDYHPEPWSPIDSLAIESEFRWYLTGRFPVIVMPELAKRVLGDGPLYREFLFGEADEEAVVPPEAYQHLREQLGQRPLESVGQATGDPEGTGSNNWVVRGVTAKPECRWSPAIRTSRLKRSRAGTRLICAVATSTWRAWPTSACPRSCSAATSESPGASPTTSARCAICIRNGSIPNIRTVSNSMAVGSQLAK